MKHNNTDMEVLEKLKHVGLQIAAGRYCVKNGCDEKKKALHVKRVLEQLPNRSIEQVGRDMFRTSV